MKIAAIITTCDRPAMLARALASLAGQTRPVDEVIVVDDGRVAATAPGARVISSGPGAGPGFARNLGARMTDADELLFLDDDDEWLPGYVATVVSALERADVVLAAVEKVHSDGIRTPEKVPPATLCAGDWLVRNQGLRGSNLAIRASAFRAVGGFDELLSCGEDMDLAIRLAEAGLRYERIEAPLVLYHAHAGPRLTSRGPRHRIAHRTWLVAQGDRLGDAEVSAYRARTQRLFGEDPGPAPRLIWVLGPPGAGKTTWAHSRARNGDRVMGMEDLMFWRDDADLGVRTAKRHIVQALRAVESRRVQGRRLFVTAAYLDPEDLGPLSDAEHVIAVVPPEPTWSARLRGRDGVVPEAHRVEHAKWAARWGVGARAADLVGAGTP